MSLKMKDLYWLAGLLEGEGCFANNGRGYGEGVPAIIIQMYDWDIIQRAHRILVPSRRPHKIVVPNRRLPFWRIKLTGNNAAGWMMTLYPLMGGRRRERIRELLSRWKVAPMRKITKYVAPQEVY